MNIEQLKIIVCENRVGIRYTTDGELEGFYARCNKPTPTVAEVVEAVNLLLESIFEKGGEG